MDSFSPMDDLLQSLRSAQSQDCQLSIARRVVQARFERGDYEMLGELGADIREAMAHKLVEEICK